ncbi:MAG TPA: peptidoglycan-binding domain-containing protein, partial [Solirubrobacteraceae bacterium]|nr:peptidoglycan-binding domain-containing protein [Solirubrobacteraceae bacterium]
MSVTPRILPSRRGTRIPPRAVAALLLAAALMAVVQPAPPAHALAGRPSTAALQVALHAEGTYAGSIDGIRGSGTARAVRAFQRRNGLAADGIAGPRTR